MENICEYHRFTWAGGDAICLLSIALPAHLLRSFAIGTMSACYETNGGAGRMEYPQVREKWAARRQPVSLPACSVLRSKSCYRAVFPYLPFA